MSLERLRRQYPRYMALVDPRPAMYVEEGLLLAVEHVLERLEALETGAARLEIRLRPGEEIEPVAHREPSPSELEIQRRMVGT